MSNWGPEKGLFLNLKGNVTFCIPQKLFSSVEQAFGRHCDENGIAGKEA